MSKTVPLVSKADGEWPNLLDESREMLEAAIMMYAFADLRELARRDKLPAVAAQRLLKLPIEAPTVLDLVKSNSEALKQCIADAHLDLYLSSLSSIQNAWHRQMVDDDGEVQYAAASKLVVFEDTNASTELVYGVAVDPARRRITVAFRGSVTLSDFLADAKAHLTSMSCPIKGGPPTLGVHHGFYDYLFGKRKRGSVNKCAIIMQQVVDLLRQHPGYRLYVTGHSLGGALATLFALHAAASLQTPAPVTCISVASPKVGNMAFRRAVQTLEEQGRLRCLRLANHKDLVTLLPDRGSFSCMYLVCCQANVYRHVGHEIKFYSAHSLAIGRAGDANDSYVKVFLQEWVKQMRHAVGMVVTLPFLCCCRENFVRYHACQEYMLRLNGNADRLEKLQLDELV